MPPPLGLLTEFKPYEKLEHYKYKITGFEACNKGRGKMFIYEYPGFLKGCQPPETVSRDRLSKYNPFKIDLYSLGILITEMLGISKENFLAKMQDHQLYSIVTKLLADKKRMKLMELIAKLKSLTVKAEIPQEKTILMKMKTIREKDSYEVQLERVYHKFRALMALGNIKEAKKAQCEGNDLFLDKIIGIEVGKTILNNTPSSFKFAWMMTHLYKTYWIELTKYATKIYGEVSKENCESSLLMFRQLRTQYMSDKINQKKK